MNRGAVGLVVGGLEHQRDVQPSADGFVVGGATQCEVEIFKNVDSAKQGEGAIVGDGGSLRSSRRRLSRVRAAHATCAACIRALPARLHRRGKAC